MVKPRGGAWPAHRPDSTTRWMVGSTSRCHRHLVPLGQLRRRRGRPTPRSAPSASILRPGAPAFNVGSKWSIEATMIGRLIADDVHERNACSLWVVEISETVGQTRSAME